MKRQFPNFDEFQKFYRSVKLTLNGKDLFHGTEYAGTYEMDNKLRVNAEVLKKHIPANQLHDWQ